LSKFSELKAYINTIPNNNIVLRKDLVKNFGAIDTYRRCFTLLGYLSDTETRGVYKKIKNIPKKITSSDLQYAYKNFRFNFNKLYESEKLKFNLTNYES